MRKRRIGTLTLVLLVALLAVATLAGTASAQGNGSYGCCGGGWPTTGGTGGGTGGGTYGPGSWCGGGVWNGNGAWGGTGAWGTSSGAAWLTGHPAAFGAYLDLRIKNIQAMKSWAQQYGRDLTSAAARQALQAIWQQNWTDMKAWYQQYGGGSGWTAPGSGCWGGGMWGSGYGSGWLTSHPAAFADYLDLRLGQVSDMKAWLAQYAGNLSGSAAQTAMQTMRSEHRAEIVKFFKDHGLTSGARWGYCGWMGLGGMWGGWGW